jgi:membrane protein YqaA with SNARE-associated domain
MPWGPVVFFMLSGKALRYILLTVVTLEGLSWFG